MSYEHLLTTDSGPHHAIPFTRDEIVQLLKEDDRIPLKDLGSFNKFSNILKSIYHFEFHSKLEKIKNNYRYFNPDHTLKNLDDEIDNNQFHECMQDIEKLLTDANYTPVTDNDIEISLSKESIFPASSEVNFNDFSTYKLFYQGESRGASKIKRRIPFLKKIVRFEYFNRVILLFRVKTLSELDPNHKISDGLKPGKLYLKYFRNIPKIDLEMIFPDPKPKMKLSDKLQIGIPLGSGLVIMLKEFVYDPYITKSSSSTFDEGIGVLAFGMLFALFGYSYQTYDQYRITKLNMLKEISQGLYFKDIGNNESVITALIDSAEEEESKEALLAYYFLLTAPAPLTSLDLDKIIEKWLKTKSRKNINFQINDSLNKLKRLGILKVNNLGSFSVLNVKDALHHLDRTWDTYFDYS